MTLKPCPFREHRHEGDDDNPVLENLLVCNAAGGYVLGTGQQTDQIQSVCSICDIPDSIKFPYACLFLIPFRIFDEDGVRSYYGCRWYMSINPRNVPKDNIWCRGCQDWFPRPPEHMIPRRIEKTYEAIDLFQNPPQWTCPQSPQQGGDTRSWHRRMLDELIWLLSWRST